MKALLSGLDDFADMQGVGGSLKYVEYDTYLRPTLFIGALIACAMLSSRLSKTANRGELSL